MIIFSVVASLACVQTLVCPSSCLPMVLTPCQNICQSNLRKGRFGPGTREAGSMQTSTNDVRSELGISHHMQGIWEEYTVQSHAQNPKNMHKIQLLATEIFFKKYVHWLIQYLYSDNFLYTQFLFSCLYAYFLNKIQPLHFVCVGRMMTWRKERSKIPQTEKSDHVLSAGSSSKVGIEEQILKICKTQNDIKS